MDNNSSTSTNTSTSYTTSPPQYGWICPKCGRVYAPNITSCLYCVNYTPPYVWQAPPYWPWGTITCSTADATIHNESAAGNNYYCPTTASNSNKEKN